MSKNFLEFLIEKRSNAIDSQIINEAFLTSDIDKAHQLLLDFFKKKLTGKTVMLPVPVKTTTNGKEAMSVSYVNFKEGLKNINVGWTINYLISGKSTEAYSVDFFDTEGTNELLFGSGNVKSKLTIYTLGQSVAYFVPLICYIVSSHDFNIKKFDAKDIMDKSKKMFNSDVTEQYFGALKMNIFEGLTDKVIDTTFHLRQGHHIVDNGTGFIWETEAEDVKKAVRAAEKESWKTKNNSKEDRERSIALDRDYREICKAINGGATTLKELEVSLGHSINVVYNTGNSKQEQQVEAETKKYAKSPEQAFKEMKAYVNTVLKGLQPGVVLCGAPGVGKTYRVLQQLKAAGYQRGKNLEIIKGKCSPRELYVSLYNYQDKGDIILIDDADSLIGPKAPEDVINILKAALDSTSDDEGRLVSYKVAGRILDEEGNEMPKSFYFRGACIVITNYSVGQIDTAIRSRVYTQSIDFSTKQLLDVIKSIMPEIAPTKLSSKCKIKAYEYLLQLIEEKAPIEISIRSFSTCANLFQSVEDDSDFSDDDCKSMIKEQLLNASKRGGTKF